MSSSEPMTLADQLERSFRGGAWHGPALLEVLAGIDAELALRRPGPGSLSIAEIVAHVSAWIEICRRRIESRGGPQPEEIDDWPPPGDPSDVSAWSAQLDLLDRRHRHLRATLQGLGEEDLAAPVAGSDPTVRGLVLGLLQHHAYHAGQIRLLARLGGTA